MMQPAAQDQAAGLQIDAVAVRESRHPVAAGAGGAMKGFVVVATHGRAKETSVLLTNLQRQSVPGELVVVVGASASDVEGLDQHALTRSGRAVILVSPRLGLTRQRNYGLDYLSNAHAFDHGETSFVVFFDDDFRPAEDWLAHCAAAFGENSELAGLTGRLLADGVLGGGLSEAEAEDYLRGALPPRRHWANWTKAVEVDCLYGCNMAFRGAIARELRFDEDLPLYAWQEDRDYSGQVRRRGLTAVRPQCVGVHLGVRGGRTNGLRLGYSQVANPLHIAARGNMPMPLVWRMIGKALLANTAKSLTHSADFDYPGRLRGNLRALGDAARGRCRPMNVVDLP